MYVFDRIRNTSWLLKNGSHLVLRFHTDLSCDGRCDVLMTACVLMEPSVECMEHVGGCFPTGCFLVLFA